MEVEQLQKKLKNDLEHFVGLGEVVKNSFYQLSPSEQGMLMYSLLMAARRLNKEMAEICRVQECFIFDVTGLNLIETRLALRNLISYFEQGDYDLEISYKYNYKNQSRSIFEPEEIVQQENLFCPFPATEHSQEYVNARKLMIEASPKNYAELVMCIESVNEVIDKILADSKKLRRDEEKRMERFKKMEDYYLENYWMRDREQLMERVKGEIDDKDNKGKAHTEILGLLLREVNLDNCVNVKDTLKDINFHRDDREYVAEKIANNVDYISIDDMMAHFRYRESCTMLNNHKESLWLLMECEEYERKLFVNEAALEFANLIKNAVACYVGFEDKKNNAAFFFAALKDLGLVFSQENNATLMSEYIQEEYEVDISADTITRPLRKCNGQPFCKIDENNLHDFTEREFKRYKDSYWRCYSIINKVLDKKDVVCAGYLKELHPTIAANDVFENLEEEEKSRLYFLASVLRGETLMF